MKDDWIIDDFAADYEEINKNKKDDSEDGETD